VVAAISVVVPAESRGRGDRAGGRRGGTRHFRVLGARAASDSAALYVGKPIGGTLPERWGQAAELGASVRLDAADELAEPR